jgi:hypothetical protein
MTAEESGLALLTAPTTSSVVTAEAVSDVQVGTHSVPQRYLYAHAMRGEVIQHVRTQASSADRGRLSEILADWDALQPMVRALQATEGGLADSIEVKPLPPAAATFAATAMADPLIAKAFGAWNHGFVMAEVGKLVLPQRTINEQYAETLMNTYPSSPALEDLLRICISPRADMAPIQHLEVAPNTHVFSSPNTDLRFLGAFLKELIGPEDSSLVEGGGMPAAAVVGFVGYGTPVIHAYKVGHRLIIGNGHHRIYALQKLGVTRIPILVLDVSNPSAEMPPAIAGMPRELFLVPRPPLAKDLLEEHFGVVLQVKERIKQLTVMMNANQYEIPA